MISFGRRQGEGHEMDKISTKTSFQGFKPTFPVRHESAPPLVAESATERILYLALGRRR